MEQSFKRIRVLSLALSRSLLLTLSNVSHITISLCYVTLPLICLYLMPHLISYVCVIVFSCESLLWYAITQTYLLNVPSSFGFSPQHTHTPLHPTLNFLLVHALVSFSYNRTKVKRTKYAR